MFLLIDHLKLRYTTSEQKISRMHSTFIWTYSKSFMMIYSLIARLWIYSRHFIYPRDQNLAEIFEIIEFVGFLPRRLDEIIDWMGEGFVKEMRIVDIIDKLAYILTILDKYNLIYMNISLKTLFYTADEKIHWN